MYCRRPFGVEKEFFVQLFFEIDQTQNHIPETEKLLTQMFLQQKTSFTKVSKQYVINYNDLYIRYHQNYCFGCLILVKILNCTTELFHH